jgi:hypothetical protein
MTRRLLPFSCLAVLGLANIAGFAGDKPPVPALKVGDPMPPIEGETLSGKKSQLPDAAGHRVALLCLGFSQNSKYAAEKWSTRFRKDFKGPEAPQFFAVPVIEGSMAHMAKPFIMGGMRKGTPKEYQDLTVVSFPSDSDWRQRMQVQDENQVYMILLDTQAKVAWICKQPFSEDAYGVMKAELSKLTR